MREVSARTALVKSRLPATDYCVNPYIGCAHACTYCYARFMRRFTGHGHEEWGTFVDARTNIAQVLQAEVQRKPMAGSVLLGSVTDAYQPAERSLCLTRSVLEVLRPEQNLAVSILTKSSLVTRDIGILSAMPAATVGLTVTSLSADAQRALEPRASLPDERIRALRDLHQAHISTYVFIGPVIPLVTNVEAIIRAVGPLVNEVWGEALNLRGADKEGLRSCLVALLGEDGASEALALAQNPEYWDDIESQFTKHCAGNDLPEPRFFRH